MDGASRYSRRYTSRTETTARCACCCVARWSTGAVETAVASGYRPSKHHAFDSGEQARLTTPLPCLEVRQPSAPRGSQTALSHSLAFGLRGSHGARGLWPGAKARSLTCEDAEGTSHACVIRRQNGAKCDLAVSLVNGDLSIERRTQGACGAIRAQHTGRRLTGHCQVVLVGAWSSCCFP